MAQDGTILLIDDEPTVAKLYGSALANRGFPVKVYSSANDALEAIHQSRPKLILTDVQMPGMNGFELCEHLQQRNRKTFPVLFVTADDKSHVVSQGLTAGGDDFLLKGMALSNIVGRITFWLATGFRGLPRHVRDQAAHVLAEAQTPLGIDRISLDRPMLDKVTEQVEIELSDVPDFGNRLVERILLLGRLTHLIVVESDGAASLLRFPDHMVAIINRLDLPWRKEMGALLAHYDLFARDVRFMAAGPQTLKSFEIYERQSSRPA